MSFPARYAVLDRLDEARRLYEQALEIYRRQQYDLGQAHILHTLGDLQQRLDRLDEARRLCEQALEIYREINDDRRTRMAGASSLARESKTWRS
jgi:tetratricopeptide (TPR) repeat protein